MNWIRQKVITIVKENCKVDPENVDVKSNLKGDLKCTDTQLTALESAFEETLGVELYLVNSKRIKTVDNLIKRVKKQY